ncbi:MAG: diguanylate cyclase [Bacilli bacterium]
MHNYNIKISVFTKDESLIRIIESIKPYDRFFYKIQKYEIIDYNAVIESDVLVFDCVVDLNEIKKNCKNNAKIVLCTDEPVNHIDQLLTNEIIRKSLDKNFIKYRMQNLLERFCLEVELNLQKECLISKSDIFFEKGPYPVLIKDINGLITNVNSQFEILFCVTKDSVVGTFYEDWSKMNFYPHRETNRSGFIEGKTKPINGEEKILELRIIDITDPLDRVYGQMCIFRDFTLERYIENQTYQDSRTDLMTGLYNRRYFNEYMENRVGNITFLSVDLDHFKEVNDNYGHDYGDAAIVLTADTLKKSFPQDTIIRMGGDEFLVIKVINKELNDIKKEIEDFLLLLRCGLKESWEFNGLSASIGVAQGYVNNNYQTLLKRSDRALYQAKENGRAGYWIDDNDGYSLKKVKDN